MPSLITLRTGAEVVSHTRGGARLKEHLNPDTKMGAKTLAALMDEKWDYVILQEMSHGPITEKEHFLKNAGYREAAGANEALIADVGSAFY